MKLPLDTYSLRARFFPAVIVLVPAVAAAAAWVPLDSLSWKTLASVGCLAALASLLSHLARDLGKRRESELFSRWDGAPTIRFLRHRDTTLPEPTRDRYHAKLATLVPSLALPSSRSEKAKPEAADDVYRSYCDWLREATRDRERFGLLFEENVGYGFRRNLWAMKPVGIALSLASLAVSGVRISMGMAENEAPAVESLAAIAISAPLLAWWLLRITPNWVKVSSEAYARQLLAACDAL
jgi:hypothetical protein